MRSLLLFRGAPGCGKSTYIDSHGLRPFALSADEIRLQCQSAQQNIYGATEISQNNEKNVWQMLFKLLDIRMSHGEFTVIDATNSKTEEINRYKDMCEQYRYRMFIIDFTKLPIEECKRRNASRDVYKRVPEEVIDKMYSRFANQPIPSGIKVIDPDHLEDIFIKRFDMSKYEKVVHIGDIHGCYTALKTYFKDGFNDNYMYIFLGDLLDRGIENVEVMNFMIEASQRKNVLILEGNHDKSFWIYANGGFSRNEAFELKTKLQLMDAAVDPSKIRQLYRKMGQCAWYTYGDKEILVTHAGVATMPENLTYMATCQMINGVGKYNDYEQIADTWMNTTKENQYQIFGHRNTKTDPTQLRDRVFDLEGKVEYGGHLRIVEIDKDGFHVVEIKNDVFAEPEAIEAKEQSLEMSVLETVEAMRDNRFIQEKKFGNISSFNFTKEAFLDAVWNKQTMVARGLYINTRTMNVVARGFNKFFNINERPETKLEMLQYTLTFPITCYVKENGYLGLVSYNEETDDLFITSKSTPDGDFSMWLREAVEAKMTPEAIAKMKEITKNDKVTFVFENVDMKNDPHIIEYPQSELYLLAIIKNDIKFAQYDYDQVVNIGNELGLKTKTKACTINSYSEFFDWYNEVTAEGYEFDGRIIEGFVIEDAAGFMVKVKLHYYNFWKCMRNVGRQTLRRGKLNKTGFLTNQLSNNFYAFCQKLYNETDPEQRELIPRDIVYLRNRFYAETKS